MKIIIITIFTSSILLILTILSANVKEKGEINFLNINDNIQNEELRTELEDLREEFDLERARIQEYYNEKIETLKGERRDGIKTIKEDFAERRKIIMNKYHGKKQLISKIKTIQAPAMENTPDQKNTSKEKNNPNP